ARECAGPAKAFLAEQAEKPPLFIVGGTIHIRDAGADRAAARSLLYGPDGRELARYEKTHLFGVDIPGREAERYLESASARAGTRVVTAALPSARIGMTVCYDI